MDQVKDVNAALHEVWESSKPESIIVSYSLAKRLGCNMGNLLPGRPVVITRDGVYSFIAGGRGHTRVLGVDDISEEDWKKLK